MGAAMERLADAFLENAYNTDRKLLLERNRLAHHLGGDLVEVDLFEPIRPRTRQSGLRQYPAHHAAVHVQLPGNRADGPSLGVIVAQDLRFDLRRRHHGALVPVVIQGGRDDAGVDAGTPDGAAPGRSGRTSGSADRATGAGQPGRQRRLGSSSRPAPTDHRPAVRVNRDASLSLAAPASGPCVPHASDGHGGSPDSAAQPAGRCTDVPAAHSRRRSRSDRGHSNCKRSPAGGNRHTGTGGLIADRPAPRRSSGVDEHHPWQDTRPACVPGTMWGHGAEPDCQVTRPASCLPPNSGKPSARRLPRSLGSHPCQACAGLSAIHSRSTAGSGVTPLRMTHATRRRLCADSHRR